MSSKTETSVWTPLRDAVAQARTLDKQARKIAKQTADELYSRSEALLTQAQKRSAKTVKTVRKNVEAALETIESRTVRIADVRDWARKQLNEAETQLRNGVEVVARGLHIALDKDVDALRRKVSHLEKRVTELSGESKAA
jgi:polyhydroxyalkanoate synthesis regulator phasin